MFLSKSNKIKWNLLLYSFVVLLFITIIGIFVFDRFLFLYLRYLDNIFFRCLGYVFDTKVWLSLFGMSCLCIYVYKSVRDKKRVTYKKYKCVKKRICKCTDVIALRYNNFINILQSFFCDVFNKLRNTYSLYIFSSVFFASIVAALLKVLFGRARPIFFEALDMIGFYPFSFDWAFNSFPSGHTVAAFSGLVMIGLLKPTIKQYTWAIAIVVGLSRICVGAHWSTDVLVGAFIGMVVADFTKCVLCTIK